jgi:glutamyl-tRNA synthetase
MTLMAKLIPLVKERLKVLSDVVEMSRFLFTEIEAPKAEDLLPKKQDAVTTLLVLERILPEISSMATLDDAVVEEQLMKLADELHIKVNGVFMPIRVAVTGSTVSPPLFDSIRLLGLDITIARIERAISILKNEVE